MSKNSSSKTPKRQAIQRLRGMYDVLPNEIHIWQHVENTCEKLFSRYCFDEIRFPVVEKTSLFHSAIGEATDVVEKEMFSFESRGGSSISLRPEGTAGCVRAVIQNDLCNRGLIQKLWYKGPMFRYERPQKGRNRQFTQIGAEILNIEGAHADAELILMTARLWKKLKLPNIRLEINTLGTQTARIAYREVLIEFFKKHINILDDDALRRLESNPLRILDSKNPAIKALVKDAPVLEDYLDDESKVHFKELKNILDSCGIAYQINNKLVRGLDYYSKTVFEWITDDLGSQSAICAGGRYDTLVELQGGKATPAVGFAMGVDRIVELMKDLNLLGKPQKIDAFLVTDKNIGYPYINSISEKIRTQLPNLNLIVNPSPSSFKSQLKKCDKLAVEFALIIGENEMSQNTITLKALKNINFEQKQLTIDELVSELSRYK